MLQTGHFHDASTAVAGSIGSTIRLLAKMFMTMEVLGISRTLGSSKQEATQATMRSLHESRPSSYQLFFERLFSMLQTRHFRGVSRVDFKGVFCMGCQMLATTTPMLVLSRAIIKPAPR
jgi:hypothetical protein